MAALDDWLDATFGGVAAPERFARALTHGSQAADNYERLEFLGDRVLGLTIAEWLYSRYPAEPEGKLSRRLNALVTGPVCADVARSLGIRDQLRLGKQARDDGAADSDNVLGDVMEALIGALFLERGFDRTAAFVREAWGDRIDAQGAAPRHPKSALQEWAAANQRRAPEYAIVDRSGPHHAPRFKVSVSLGNYASAEGEGASKQEAETAAATALLKVVEKR
ncbi:ribonuclease III [Sphingomonas sp. Y38-1Y]|uniref:ribonuclease III n=1 Tax=Sphingomonas sp. Y38-1Y TaxID=3078265 RepID=UPI0028E29965|nr:ribonuclease III [Sphingomonas sp. Y38-1Y]